MRDEEREKIKERGKRREIRRWERTEMRRKKT